MAMQTTAATQPEIIYPETDGEPMAQNTKQAEVMMTLKENLDALFADRDDVFVAIDHFWYPVKGHPEHPPSARCDGRAGTPQRASRFVQAVGRG
jgi:hypothetical protein